MKSYHLPELSDWIQWQETAGRQLNARIESILKAEGKVDSYTLEDVQQAQVQAKTELRIR